METGNSTFKADRLKVIKMEKSIDKQKNILYTKIGECY